MRNCLTGWTDSAEVTESPKLSISVNRVCIFFFFPRALSPSRESLAGTRVVRTNRIHSAEFSQLGARRPGGTHALSEVHNHVTSEVPGVKTVLGTYLITKTSKKYLLKVGVLKNFVKRIFSR